MVTILQRLTDIIDPLALLEAPHNQPASRPTACLFDKVPVAKGTTGYYVDTDRRLSVRPIDVGIPETCACLQLKALDRT